MPAQRYTRWDDFAAGAEASEQHEPAAQRYRSWDDFATDAEASEQRELDLAAPEDEDTGTVATDDIIEEWSDDGWMDDWSMSSSASPNEDHR